MVSLVWLISAFSLIMSGCLLLLHFHQHFRLRSCYRKRKVFVPPQSRRNCLVRRTSTQHSNASSRSIASRKSSVHLDTPQLQNGQQRMSAFAAARNSIGQSINESFDDLRKSLPNQVPFQMFFMFLAYSK